MSGAEAVLLLGMISSIIIIVDDTKQIFDAARNTQGLPEAFRVVAGGLPIIANNLGSASRQIEQRNIDEQSCKGVKDVVEACEKKAKVLEEMFKKAIPEDDASGLQQYINAVRTIGRASKVEDLMKGMLRDIQLLAGERGVTIATEEVQRQIMEALTALSAVPPSVPDSEFQESSITATNTGSGDQYNAREQYNAQGSARQYISGGGPMNFETRDYNTTVSDPATQSSDPGTSSSTVPQLKVAHYVDRPELHSQLEAGLHAVVHDHVERSNIVVVHGHAGAGKTQLVLHHIQKYSGDYSGGVLWINAGNQALLDANMAVLYRILYKIPMTSGAQPLPAHEIRVQVKTWFSSRQDKWLLVFDGADSVTDIQDVDYVDLISLIPSAPSVHVLVTTRSRIPQLISSKTVTVSSLEPNQALQLLWSARNLQGKDVGPDNRAVAESIVREVSYLAQAVELAGAIISKSSRMQADFSLYLSKYRSSQRELLEKPPTRLITEYDKGILTALETTFKHLQGRLRPATNMLGFLALLDPSDIYLEMFEMALEAGSDSSGEQGSESPCNWMAILSGEPSINIGQIKAGLAALTAFSLMRYERNFDSYLMHKLVHEWSYQRLSHDDQAKLCEASTQFLAAAIKHSGHDPKNRARLMNHVSQSFQISSRRLDDLSEAEWHWFRVQFHAYFMFAKSLGRWNECDMIGKVLCQTHLRRLGEEHPDTMTAMNAMAVTLAAQGRLQEAVAIEEKVLETRRRILGDRHPDTISVMKNLASTLNDQGRFEDAESMQREVLEKARQILGEDSQDATIATNYLALTLRNQGRFEEAAAMQREVLEKTKRTLGDEHPSTISVMNNLANTLGEHGELEEAVLIRREILENRRRVLGEDHPTTISVIGNLAITLREQGELMEAAEMQREALEKIRRILGEEHPKTILDTSSLAITLGDLGELQGAITLQREVLEKRKRILGEDHPDTILTMSNLARILGDQGQFEEATTMFNEALQKIKQTLGIEHPDVVLMQYNMTVLDVQMQEAHAAAANQQGNVGGGA